MIWRIPWCLAVVALHLARFLSWLCLPTRLHGRIWGRDLCRWAMHDDEPLIGTLVSYEARCRRCGRETWTPAPFGNVGALFPPEPPKVRPGTRYVCEASPKATAEDLERLKRDHAP